MAAKSGSVKTSGKDRRNVDAVDKDRLIAELNDKILLLEKELRSKQEIATSTDIAERKRAEDALVAAYRQFQSIMDNTPDIVYVFDLGERFTMANAAVAELFNSTPEQLIGKRRHEFMPKEEADWHEANDRQAIEAGRALEFEEYSQLKGRSITWLTKKFPLHDADGRICAVAGISADISERKRAEEALQNTSDYLESLINYANAPIIVWDPAHKITRFNHAFEHLTGYAADEVIGKRLDLLFPEESREESLCKIQRTLTEHWESVEIPILGRDGWVRIALWNSANIYDKDGKTLLATIAQGQDITERKQIEKKLNAAKMQAELYLDLMGHDINNMHQIALGYLELARDMQADGGGSEYLVRPIEVLQRSALLIQNVRKLQKLKEGVFQTHGVDVSKVLSDVHLEYGISTHKAITLNLNGHEHCYVKANELLHDVFANLVSNAIKHTGDQADIVIDMDVVKEDGSGYCRVMIEDNGPGIPDDLKCMVFNRMLRGTTSVQGIGLGLYLVKSLVESYGGRVWVGDRVSGDHSKGATFVVMLPAVDTQ